MIQRRIQLVIVILAAWSGGILTQMTFAQRRSPLMITRIFAGPDGLARAEARSATFTSAQTPTRGTLETYQAGVVSGNATVARISPDYIADWHPVARHQYVIQLSGQREIEVADGKKIRAEPDTVLLVEDVTGKGHLTRGVGTEDSVTLIIPLADQT